MQPWEYWCVWRSACIVALKRRERGKHNS